MKIDCKACGKQWDNRHFRRCPYCREPQHDYLAILWVAAVLTATVAGIVIVQYFGGAGS